MIRLVLGILALLALAGCGAEPVWAPDDVVAQSRYEHPGPPTVTLFTVLNNRSNEGAHAGLMISGSERVMFDPAGTWHHPALPERNDVHFGVTPKMEAFYVDYHARETFRVLVQTVEVTPEQAELMKQRAKAYGAVPKANCGRAVSSVMRGVPGFESLPQTWYPKTLSEAFAELPGVTSQVLYDDDADKNHGVLLVQQQDLDR
jgi:hypothetical protein